MAHDCQFGAMSLTISRTPLRITLGGGGSDLAPDGLCVTAAINLYTYVVVNRNRGSEYILKYSDKVERVSSLEEIQHPLISSCLEALNVEPGIEIAWLSDIDGSMGLGSSASFVVGTLRALGLNEIKAAELAIKLDTGWQDQWACALGGVRLSSKYITKRLNPQVKPFINWSLISTDMKHDANQVLKENGRPEQSVLVNEALHVATLLTEIDDEQLLNYELSQSLNFQRRCKFDAAPSLEHNMIQEQFEGLNAWKLIGAGNGGYVLTSDDMVNGLKFEIDHQGSVIL